MKVHRANIVGSLIAAQILAIFCARVVSAQGAIASGEARDGAISIPLETDSWTFTASAGDSILVRVGEVADNGNFDPLIQLLSPTNVLLGSASGSLAAEVAVTATSSGTFTVLVSDGVAGGNTSTGTYRLYLAKLPGAFVVADDGGPLTNGGNHDGTIALGDLDLWSFTASSGDSIVLRIGELTDDGNGFDPLIRLYGPDGGLLGSSSGVLSAEVAVTAPSTGTFTVLVSDGVSGGIIGTGTYRLHFAKAPGAFVTPNNDDGGPLTNGGNHDGTIALGDLDLWSFSASSGDSIVLRIGELTDDGNGFDPLIRLYGPDGGLLGSSSGVLSAEVAVTAPSSGTFTVLVSDGVSGGIIGTGTYRLHFAKAPGAFVTPNNDDGGPLTNGGNHDGTIALGDLDLWSFAASSGDSIVLRIGKLTDDGNGFDPLIRLYAPDGGLLGSSSGVLSAEVAVTAPSSGTFTVLVSDGVSGGIIGTGMYRLHFAKVPGAFVVADDGGPLTNGGNHDGTIALGDLDLWSFTANSGDSIVLRIGKLTDDGNGFDPLVRLYGPDGGLLGSSSGVLSAEVAVTAPSSGTFTVLVSDGVSGGIIGTGTYRLHFAKLPGAFVVPSNDEGGVLVSAGQHDGTVLLGDLDLWSFGASSGDNIVVQITELTDDGNSFDPLIRLYAPNGTLLDSASGTVSAQILRTAPSSGTFTVVVSDGVAGGIVGTGTYRLTISGINPPPTPTPPTSTPTPTPTAQPTVMLSTAVAAPGGRACVPVTLSGHAGPLSTSNTVGFDATNFTFTTAAINPAIGPSSAPDKQLATESLGIGSQKFDVSGANAVPIPDGLLYTASFTVGASVVPGTYPLSGTPGGQIIVTTCTGDCNGNHQVSIGEVTKCINLFLGQPLCNLSDPVGNCPVADANLNGAVSIGEVTQCINRFLGGCS